MKSLQTLPDAFRLEISMSQPVTQGPAPFDHSLPFLLTASQTPTALQTRTFDSSLTSKSLWEFDVAPVSILLLHQLLLTFRHTLASSGKVFFPLQVVPFVIYDDIRGGEEGGNKR